MSYEGCPFIKGENAVSSVVTLGGNEFSSSAQFKAPGLGDAQKHVAHRSSATASQPGLLLGGFSILRFSPKCAQLFHNARKVIWFLHQACNLLIPRLDMHTNLSAIKMNSAVGLWIASSYTNLLGTCEWNQSSDHSGLQCTGGEYFCFVVLW